MQRTALTLNILIAILLLLVSARILADLAAYKIGTLTPSGQAAQANNSSSGSFNMPFMSFGVILEKGLFGTATKGQLTTIEAPRAATIATTRESAQPVAPTDLTLLGTVTGVPRQSFALIRKTSTNEERVFKTGEQVFNLGLLATVEKETVTIKNNDKTTTLRTPDAALEEQKPVATPPKAEKKSSGGVVAATTGSGGIIEQRALNAALSNIGQVMTDARMLPSSKDGEVIGFELSEVKPEGVFGSIGLKDGDILQKINDFPIDSPEKAIQSFMTLKGQTNIRLGLIRNGSPTTLSYEIR